MEVTPRDEQREDFGFACAGRHFQNVTRPVFIEHSRGNRARGIEAKQVKLVACAFDFVKPNDGFNCFALGEVVIERRERTVGGFGQMFGFKPLL